MRHRRTTVAIAAGLVLLVGCSSGEPSGATDATDGAFQSCGPVENQPIQGGTHLIGDAEPPEPYSSVPGTSGWHTGPPLLSGVVDEPVEDPEIVAALEAGRVLLVHDGSVDTTAVEHLVEESSERLVVAEYAGELPTPVSLVAWGRLARCDELDFADVTAFVLDQSGRGPDSH